MNDSTVYRPTVQFDPDAAKQIDPEAWKRAEQVRLDRLTRPIAGIENRTPQEVFEIMCDRIRGSRA